MIKERKFENIVKLAVGILIVSFFLSGCRVNSSNTRSVNEAELGSLADAQIQIGEQKLEVEIADTPESITLGLGERDEIGSDGMLFILPKKQIVSFWMKGMRFPLDMIWIDGDRVIGVTADVPIIPRNIDLTLHDPEVYPSPGEVTHVLEVEAGKAAQLGIKSGDSFQFISPM